MKNDIYLKPIGFFFFFHFDCSIVLECQFKFQKSENKNKVFFFFFLKFYFVFLPDLKMDEAVPTKPPRGVKIKEQGQNKEPVVSKNSRRGHALGLYFRKKKK